MPVCFSFRVSIVCFLNVQPSFLLTIKLKKKVYCFHSVPQPFVHSSYMYRQCTLLYRLLRHNQKQTLSYLRRCRSTEWIWSRIIWQDADQGQAHITQKYLIFFKFAKYNWLWLLKQKCLSPLSVCILSLNALSRFIKVWICLVVSACESFVSYEHRFNVGIELSHNLTLIIVLVKEKQKHFFLLFKAI